MQRYKNKNCSYNCNWKCDNECQYKKVINVNEHYKKDINETNLDYDDFISIMLKKNNNISFNKSNIKDEYQNIILETKHIDLNKTFLDTEFLMKIICGIEDNIINDLDTVFTYLENIN